MTFHQLYIQQQDSSDIRFSSQDFDVENWQTQPGSLQLSGGRGGSLKILLQGQALVLHRYLRGGLVAKLFHDRYVWSGLKHTRPFKEWQVVEYADKAGLPVPEMLGFCVQRQGLFYRAASISRFVENQGSLADYITQSPLGAENWRKLGAVIRKMHQAMIDHVDLNANNILIGPGMRFYLIDFDKASIKSGGTQWQVKNLQRLKRSLMKIQLLNNSQENPFHFSDSDWVALMHGYQSGVFKN